MKKIPPLLRTLADQLPAVTSAARDKEAAVRLEVGRTLEALAFARREYLDYEKNLLKVGGDKLEGGKGQGRVTPGQPVALTGRAAGELATADAADQPLLNGLRKAVPTLALLTGDVNAEVRLAALSALDLLEEEAAPAVDALVKALADKNPFARWSAAFCFSVPVCSSLPPCASISSSLSIVTPTPCRDCRKALSCPARTRNSS